MVGLASLSRLGFAARFKRWVGETPMHDLTPWRRVRTGGLSAVGVAP
jgi:AraC-like DNA-binding protein